MPEDIREGGAILNEEAERQKKAEDEAKASLEALLEHERVRRRNRWVFFGCLGLFALILLPIVALYIAFVLALAIKLALSLA